MKILFLGKKNDHNALLASQYTKQLFPETDIYFVIRGEEMPKELYNWEGDYIFSYICAWVLPKEILDKAQKGAINWHPGSPDYPGIGCTNFAIYNEEKTFGITCHYMLPKVDSGQIIDAPRFEILPNDSVFSITQKCYALILTSFFGILEKIAQNKSLPQSKEKWTREAYKRTELQALCKIDILGNDKNIDEKTLEKRIKATTFDKKWLYIELFGKKFYLGDE